GGGRDTLVGGTAQGAGNLIQENHLDGINIASGEGTRIEGNVIGAAVADSPDFLSNGGNGVELSGGGLTIIGGTSPEARNVISCTLENGVEVIDGSDVRIEGNYIGLDIHGDQRESNGL